MASTDQQDVVRHEIPTPVRRGARSIYFVETWLTGFALFGWALLAYLTVPFSGDRLAEGIQVQRLLKNPQFVLSYPGQRYGGVIEYPFLMAAEKISPGNPYALTFLRLILVPAAGVFSCLVFARLFPAVRLWVLTAAAVCGPAVLHGPMIVNALYPMSWTLGMGGIAVLCRALDRGSEKVRPFVIAGLLIGLAIYEHPSVVMLVIPLLTMVGLRWSTSVSYRRVATFLGGAVCGLVPLVVSYLGGQQQGPLVSSPIGMHVPPLVETFGFGEGPNAWVGASVPNGWGFLNGPTTAFDDARAVRLTLSFVLVIVLLGFGFVAFRAMLRGPRLGHPVAALELIAIGWVTAVLVTIGLMVVVLPVWFYGTSLGFLVWITVGALPFALPRRWGLAVVTLTLVVAASTTLRTSRATIADVGALTRSNRGAVSAVRAEASRLVEAGALVVYGDYWQVVPLGYFSGGDLTPVSTTFNRFDVPESAQRDGTVMVAVDLQSTAPQSQVAAQTVIAACVHGPQPHIASSGFEVFVCPITMWPTTSQ